MKFKMSKTNWLNLGKKANWVKESMAISVDPEAEKSFARHSPQHIQEALNDLELMLSWKPKIDKVIERWELVLGSADTPEAILGLSEDVLTITDGLRRVHINFYNGLKDLRREAHLVELNDLITVLYDLLKYLYEYEEAYRSWVKLSPDVFNANDKQGFLEESVDTPNTVKKLLAKINAEVVDLKKAFSPVETPTVPPAETPKVEPPIESVPPPVQTQKVEPAPVPTPAPRMVLPEIGVRIQIENGDQYEISSYTDTHAILRTLKEDGKDARIEKSRLLKRLQDGTLKVI